ncbi:MAG: RNA-binding S4 domain-containing protein [Bacteroidales bacterium]|nr:RNA-binding S4 domain-containing protein [Candidatus Cryptobacteroides fimicaballi]
MDSERIDKYLWAVRVFKTRSEATDACNGNKVQINGVNAKASKAVKIGDSIKVRKGTVLYEFKVIQLSGTRMGASLVPEFAQNLTPESELAKLHAPVETFFVKRDRGSGRPTKKERRELDALWDEFDQ